MLFAAFVGMYAWSSLESDESTDTPNLQVGGNERQKQTQLPGPVHL